jgi:DNA-binding beta-propeller fold protein YncE
MNSIRTASRARSLGLAAALSLPLAACAGRSLLPPGDAPSVGDAGDAATAPRALATNGSAMLLTPDDRIAVSIQRAANAVVIFTVGEGVDARLAQTATIETGDGSEPWMGVIGNDGDTAYVILRRDAEVVRVVGLHSATPHIDGRAPTGSEPTGIAIAPSGRDLYVTNWNDGSVTVVSAADMRVERTIDLDQALARSGMLGPALAERTGAGGAVRNGLAHPRSIVITNDGDERDDDETAYVTEFFSQWRPDAPTTPDGHPDFDASRQGVVYRFALGGGSDVALTTIAPIADTGVNDSHGEAAGCVPNQLQAPTLHGNRLYVASVCASPDGPTGRDNGSPIDPDANFRTIMHPALFVIDTTTNLELHDEAFSLAGAFRDLYGRAHVADTSDPPAGFLCDGARQRYPHLPSDMAFAPGTNDLYISSYGTNAVFRVALEPGRAPVVGFTTDDTRLQYVELVVHASTGATDPDNVGRLPIGLAFASHAATMLVTNENTRNVSWVDMQTHAARESVRAATLPDANTPEGQLVQARMFFVTGAGRWAFRGQGWSSCEGCHPDGLSDGITWMFPRGPRQSPSLAAAYPNTQRYPDARHRLYSWTAGFDEVQDLESITRNLEGGVGAIVVRSDRAATEADRIIFDADPGTVAPNTTATPQDFLFGSAASISSHTSTAPLHSVLDSYDFLRAYVETIRAPRPPSVDAARVANGARLFHDRGCFGCHGGPNWSVSRVFYTPNDATNGVGGSLVTRTYMLPSGFPSALNPPASTGSAPFRFAPAFPRDGTDSINCALRAVGTFPSNGLEGVAPVGVPVYEARANGSLAWGQNGFNPPSLIGVAAGAPYLHAGNARSLEELFDDGVFVAHARALDPTSAPMTASDKDDLIAYLSQIDKDTVVVPIDTSLGFDPDLCHDL